ncbi:MAG: helix-turn-helix transcriptional regulator, partial [Candidatus Pacearchaeota archaeon]
MIGKRLEEIRKIFRLSQKEIAKKLNIPQRTYSNYETETNRIPSEILQNIAKLFNINL